MELLEAPQKLKLLAIRLVCGERQLNLQLRVTCQGVERLVSALVDSGAYLSLLRTWRFRASCIKTISKPIRLKVTNGHGLPCETHKTMSHATRRYHQTLAKETEPFSP